MMRELLLPFSRMAIAEGKTETIRIQPQRAMTVQRLIINSDCAPFYLLEGIYVERPGKVEKILDAGCPAMVFSECAIGTRLCFHVMPGERIALFVRRPELPKPSRWSPRFYLPKLIQRWFRRWLPEPRIPMFSGFFICHVPGTDVQ